MFFLSLREFSNNTLVRPFKRFKSHGFRFHRLRHENIHNFEKNLDQNGLLRKKLEHFGIGQPKILRSKISKFFIEKFSLEIEWKWKILRSKNFENFWVEKFRSQNFSFSFNIQWKFIDENFEIFRSQNFRLIDSKML